MSHLLGQAYDWGHSVLQTHIYSSLVTGHIFFRLGSSFDGDTAECSDDDYFIMRTRYQDNAPDLEKCYNKWLFSNCSLMSMWTYINA